MSLNLAIPREAARSHGRRVTGPELVEYVRERLASYKYPRVVEFRDSLPKNAAGKIVKLGL